MLKLATSFKGQMMRKIRIEMTKAAKDRLNLLQDINALPLPLDMDTLAPFGFRFTKGVMIITHGARDVAYVPKNMDDKKSFSLMTPMTQNDTADAALRRVLSTLTVHLDRVGSVLNAEKREIAARDAEKTAEREREYADRTARTIEMLSDLWVADASLWTAEITEADFIQASRRQNHDDTMIISSGPGRFMSVLIGMLPRIRIDLAPTNVQDQWTAERDPDSNSPEALKAAIASFEAEGRKPDMTKIRDEILRMRDRTIRVNDIDLLVETIGTLPLSDYSVETYLLNPPETLTPTRIDLDHDVSLSVSRDMIKIMREGVHLRTMSLAVNTLVTGSGSNFVTVPNLRLTDETWRKFVSSAIAALAEANPEVDFEIYKEIDATILADAELNTDAGYGF